MLGATDVFTRVQTLCARHIVNVRCRNTAMTYIRIGKPIFFLEMYIAGKFSSSLLEHNIFSIVILWMPFS